MKVTYTREVEGEPPRRPGGPEAWWRGLTPQKQWAVVAFAAVGLPMFTATVVLGIRALEEGRPSGGPIVCASLLGNVVWFIHWLSKQE